MLIRGKIHPSTQKKKTLTSPCWRTQMNSWSSGQTRKLGKSAQSDQLWATARHLQELPCVLLPAWMETFFLSFLPTGARGGQQTGSAAPKLLAAQWRMSEAHAGDFSFFFFFSWGILKHLRSAAPQNSQSGFKVRPIWRRHRPRLSGELHSGGARRPWSHAPKSTFLCHGFWTSLIRTKRHFSREPSPDQNPPVLTCAKFSWKATNSRNRTGADKTHSLHPCPARPGGQTQSPKGSKSKTDLSRPKKD